MNRFVTKNCDKNINKLKNIFFLILRLNLNGLKNYI